MRIGHIDDEAGDHQQKYTDGQVTPGWLLKIALDALP
jgi:hypothetical protein